MSIPPRTAVYIDGFNLYYRAVKKTPYKWLDLLGISKRILPGHDIVIVKYFTAIVTGSNDPKQPLRQDAFIRANEAVGGVKTFRGLFATHSVWRPLTSCPSQKVQVQDTKEKGSDVNLAAHFINDAWLNCYDVGVIVSNDSDLATAIKLVKCDARKTIGIVNPGDCRMAKDLKGIADFTKTIRHSDLAACQMPDKIPGTSLFKPAGW